jgi:hypothetical protein
VVLACTVAPVGPAAAAAPIEARGVALAGSASCSFGDVDVDYAASGVDRQHVTFTSEDGSVLDEFESGAYQADYVGVEHILTAVAAEPDTTSQVVPAPGTALGVYVRIGAGQPSPETTAEFFVLYRCTADGNEAGGDNEVLQTCVGDDGTCPRSAGQALAVPPVGAPRGVAPRYTG